MSDDDSSAADRFDRIGARLDRLASTVEQLRAVVEKSWDEETGPNRRKIESMLLRSGEPYLLLGAVPASVDISGLFDGGDTLSCRIGGRG